MIMELSGHMQKGIVGMEILEVQKQETCALPSFGSEVEECHSGPFSFKAITRGVSRNIGACELTYRCREEIDYQKAIWQLERYCELLRKWNVDLMPMPGSDSYPDCCFVQDTAVVLDEVCVIASMGAPARLGEVSEVEKLVAPFRKIRRIIPPGNSRWRGRSAVWQTALCGSLHPNQRSRHCGPGPDRRVVWLYGGASHGKWRAAFDHWLRNRK